MEQELRREADIRRDVRSMLHRIIAAGGSRRKKGMKSTKGMGMYELEGEGIRAGRKRKSTRKKKISCYSSTGKGLYARGMSAGKKRKSPKKSSNPWIQHVKKYARQHGMDYAEALMSPGIRKGYKPMSGMGKKRISRKRVGMRGKKKTYL